MIQTDFDLLRVRFKGHWYYGIPYKQESILMLLICHDALAKSRNDTNMLLNSLVKGFGNAQPSYVYASRFKSRENLPCYDKLILEACVTLRAFPMLIIKDIDVRSLVRCESLDLLPTFGFGEPSFAQEDIIEDTGAFVEEVRNSQRSLFCEIDAAGDISLGASCSTEICVVDDLQEQIVNINSQRPGSFFSSSTEILDDPEPYQDTNGTLLRDDNFFLNCFKRIVKRFPQDTVSLYPATNFDSLGHLRAGNSRSTRFLIVPLLTFDVKILIIIYHDVKELGYINGSPSSYQETFQYVKDALIGLGDYTARVIGLANSFHRDYELVHLMMAVVCLRRAFEFNDVVPEAS